MFSDRFGHLSSGLGDDDQNGYHVETTMKESFKVLMSEFATVKTRLKREKEKTVYDSTNIE